MAHSNKTRHHRRVSKPVAHQKSSNEKMGVKNVETIQLTTKQKFQDDRLSKIIFSRQNPNDVYRKISVQTPGTVGSPPFKPMVVPTVAVYGVESADNNSVEQSLRSRKITPAFKSPKLAYSTRKFMSAQPKILSKFTSAVGKLGQARETREFVSRALNSANPMRQAPTVLPMDYEKFISEKSAQLEHDRDRDLLLFLRDDISQSELPPKERTAVGSVTQRQLREAEWLLSADALRHYSSPYWIINFNYAKFAGDFKKLELTQSLNHLRFESDIALEEEKLISSGQQLSSDIVKEGFLVVVPGENSFVDNFRSEKKRYCIVRRDGEGRLTIDVFKYQQPAQQTPQIQPQDATAAAVAGHPPPLEIKSAVLKNTKKGKTVLQLTGNPEKDKRTLILSAENDAELAMWLVEIDRALSLNYREDSLSMGSSGRCTSVQLPSISGDTESTTSDENSASLRDLNLGMVWRGRNAAAKALHPPIVERRNIFSLYWDLEPLPDSDGEPSALILSSTDERKLRRNVAKTAPLATFESTIKQKSGSVLPTSSPSPPSPLSVAGGASKSLGNAEAVAVSPSPSLSSMDDERPSILFVAEIKRLNARVSVAGGKPEQIEPFFIQMFLFDASSGLRISEEFPMDVYPPSTSSFYNNGSVMTPTVSSAAAMFESQNQLSTASMTAAAANGQPPTTRPSEKLRGIDRRHILHPDANKLICTIPNPRPDIFLVAKVERLLSDCPMDAYMKGSVDSKNATKVTRSIGAAAQRLARYRTMFAFAVRPVFPSMCSTGGAFGDPRCLSLLRCEGRLTDADLQKTLTEFVKLEKSGKLVSIPGASISIDAEITLTVSDLTMRVSPSLLPLRPWRAPSDSPLAPAFELQSFVTDSIYAEPFGSQMNMLYVHPICLNYGGQKSFNRARNIACTVRFVGSPLRNAENINAIIDRTDPAGPYVRSKTCAVQYHEYSPQFNDEVKVKLPCALDAMDHLLFTFTHLSVANALSAKAAGNEPVEAPIGYAWLPLVRRAVDGLEHLTLSADVQDFDLPVAINLPAGYVRTLPPTTAASSIGNSSGAHAPEIKYVDGGRSLFRVRLRLVSSIFSTDESVQSFFQIYQAMECDGLIAKPTETIDKYLLKKEISSTSFVSNMASSSSTSFYHQPNRHLNRSCSPYGATDEGGVGFFEKEDAYRQLVNKLKGIATTEIHSLVSFLHPILNRLLTLLTCSPNEEVALNALNVIIVIVDRMAEVKSRNEFVRDFVYLHARYVTKSGDSEVTTHEALCKYLPILIRHVHTDLKAMSAIFKQMWFLLDCTVKFMAQFLIENKLFKVLRRNRFSTPFLFSVESLLQYLADQIMAKHRNLPAETKCANLALANFIKYCLSIIDRHMVMNQIHYIVSKLDAGDSRAFRSFKLDLLRVIVGHEHWIPLCLPLLTDKSGNVMRSDSGVMTAMLDNSSAPIGKSGGSGGFFSKFFAQIFSTSAAVQESSEADRYANYLEHFYLCAVYCQTHFLSGVLLQELHFALRDSREHRRRIIILLRNLLSKHSADVRYTDSSAQNRIAVLYTPIIRIVVSHIRELEAAAKWSAESPDVSPQNAIIQPQTAVLSNSVRSQKLTSEDRLTGASSISSLSFGGKNLRSSSKASTLPPQTSLADTVTLTNLSSIAAGELVSTASNVAATAVTSSTAVIFAEKLDKQEARDLILCVLYILNRLPKRTLGTLWCAQETIKNNSESALTVGGGGDAAAAEKSGGTSQPGSAAHSTNVYLDFIRMLELALFIFRYRRRSYHVREQAKRQKCAAKASVNFQSYTDQQHYCTNESQFSSTSNVSSSSGNAAMSNVNALNDAAEESSSEVGGAPTAMSFLQDCHLTQEVALIVLDTAQTLANQIALSADVIDAAFQRLLKLIIQLLDVNWPESVRLHALAALAVFINLFSAQFFQNGPLDCLSSLIEAILLQFNSRFVRVQNAAAALLQLILRNGFDVVSNVYGREYFDNRYGRSNSLSATSGSSIVERLGRPGSQTSVALAYLLGGGQKHSLLLTLGGARFERGLGALESFVVNYGDNRDSPSLFERGVQELVKQLRGVLEATSALSEASNDPIRLADLHIQLANSYRGSAALRCAWFDTLANIHATERWYAEAAVCQAHSIAIIGKELALKNEIKIDWTLLDMINADVTTEENVFEQQLDSTQQAGYTLENFTSKVEQTLQTLVLSERYEAVGPLCRLVIPIYERAFDYKALVSLYAELQQSYSRAAEIKASGKRHLGSYFRVVFYGAAHFKAEHKTEWVFREPRLTSLAEACDRMVELLRQSLNHDAVEILPPEQEVDVDTDRLKPTTAYVLMTHVEPCAMECFEQRQQSSAFGKNGSNNNKTGDPLVKPIDAKLGNNGDPMTYRLHTNVRTFVYEERITDANAPSNAPEQARIALKRIVLTSSFFAYMTEKCFPNTRRRQRVVGRKEFVLTPLDVACDSLIFKASQIRKILHAAGISRGAYGFDKAALRRLDLKQLQLFLQGSVSPTVNAGVLSYAEAFTAPAQKSRYGEVGLSKLVSAFKTLMTELADALRVNEGALSNDRLEYQSMLRNSFDGMLERLCVFFDDEKFVLPQKSSGANYSNLADSPANVGASNIFGLIAGTASNVSDSASNRQSVGSAMHVLNSISGVNP